MQSKQNLGQLTFGFDIGIASVGWAVLNETRIVDLGVRCFDKAETAKEGESLNLVRRTARLTRRRLRRRAWRLTKVARLLKKHHLIADVAIFKPENPFAISLWELRKQGLDRLLSAEEWARVIYHLCKHRGFHWVSKAEKLKEDDSAGETGKVKKGLAATSKLMKDKGYRSAAEMVLAEFPQAQRNKQGEYTKALERELLSFEFTELFKQQQLYNNPHVSAELETKLLNRKTGLFWAQKPSLSGEALLKMLGKCTFEKAEYRAAKASFTAERHVWLTRLNNLRIVVDGITRQLNDAERNVALQMPYNQASELTYKQLKTAMIKESLWLDSVKFAGFPYPSQTAQEAKLKDPEAATLIKMPAFKALQNTLKKAGLETEWQGMVCAAMAGDVSLLDQIACVLSIYKEDDEVKRELNKLNLPSKAKMLDALLGVRFNQFSNLSLKALLKIVPHMEQGLRYDQACLLAGYHHSQIVKTDDEKLQYLPPFYSSRDKTGKLLFNEDLDIPRNPVVLRALNQARKVMNALIKKFGAPHQINIEMARDLSRPLDERREIEALQKEFKESNDKDRAMFNVEFNTTGELKGKDFEKYQLYREQQAKCAYSIEPINLERLFELGYVEIDHALPYSRSFDDSKNNRVLVHAKENRNKGNRTPYEYLGGEQNSEGWRNFVAFVNSTKTYRQAKRNKLLRKDFGGKEAEAFRERNLNDTRYICKFFKNYVEQFLQLAKNSESKRCVVLSGQMTAFLRARWQLTKVRADSDRHHALDAAVVAACSHSMVKRLSDYSRTKELKNISDGFVDVETGEVINPSKFAQLKAHFPEPWAHFRQELEARRMQDDVAVMQAEIANLGTYSEDELAKLKPLFVSRAPQRRNSGAAHKETIYGQTERLAKTNSVTQKQSVTSLSLKDMEKLIDPRRNEKLYTAIAEWLKGKDEREKRAKEIEASLGRGKEKRSPTEVEKADIARLRELPRKPTNDGSLGPIVRTITTMIDKLSGIPIRNGIAKNDSMLRVDVFTKTGKFHLVPVYVHHALAKKVEDLPNRAVVAFKDEADWTLIDNTFSFCFSLYPNDYVKVTQKGKPSITGYYSSCHRGTGSLNIWSHDRNKSVGKNGIVEGVGVKTALLLEKFNVDVLGSLYSCAKEDRRGLA